MRALMLGRCSRLLFVIAAAGLILNSCSPVTHFFRVVDHTNDVESVQLILCGKDPFFERSEIDRRTLNLKLAIECEQNGVIIMSLKKGGFRASLTPYLPSMLPSTTTIWHVYTERVETKFAYWDEISQKWSEPT